MADSEETIQGWANRLRFFRFFRGVGGHANDGETLRCAFSIETVADLRQLLTILDVEIVEHSSLESTEVGSSLIPGTRWIEQPNLTNIAGQRVLILAEYGRLDLFLGLDYEITEEDVESALVIEQVLDLVPFSRIDPPHESYLYVMPEA